MNEYRMLHNNTVSFIILEELIENESKFKYRKEAS